jgi:predicted acetyltransferase
MSVSLRDSRAYRADQLFIERMYGDFVNDLAPDSTGVFPPLAGLAIVEGDDDLQRWLADPQVHLLTILLHKQPAGFAVVSIRRGSGRPGEATNPFRMTEFFIARPLRRRGVGRAAVRLLFDRFAGDWLGTQSRRHAPAVAFGRRVMAQYSGGRYQERADGDEIHQRLRTGTAPSGPVPETVIPGSAV